MHNHTSKSHETVCDECGISVNFKNDTSKGRDSMLDTSGGFVCSKCLNCELCPIIDSTPTIWTSMQFYHGSFEPTKWGPCVSCCFACADMAVSVQFNTMLTTKPMPENKEGRATATAMAWKQNWTRGTSDGLGRALHGKCIGCAQAYSDEDVDMIGCERCNEWVHFRCIPGYQPTPKWRDKVENRQHYYCHKCTCAQEVLHSRGLLDLPVRMLRSLRHGICKFYIRRAVESHTSCSQPASRPYHHMMNNTRISLDDLARFVNESLVLISDHFVCQPLGVEGGRAPVQPRSAESCWYMPSSHDSQVEKFERMYTYQCAFAQDFQPGGACLCHASCRQHDVRVQRRNSTKNHPAGYVHSCPFFRSSLPRMRIF